MPRICGSIMLVFLANALWHGARWNYMISGLLHGIYRVTELLAGRALSRAGWAPGVTWHRPVRIMRTFVVFSLMTFAFMFFRGASLAQTLNVTGRLLSGWGQFSLAALSFESLKAGLPPSYLVLAAGLILIVEAAQFLKSAGPLRPRIAALPAYCRWGLYYAAAAAVLLFAAPGSEPFVYVQF